MKNYQQKPESEISEALAALQAGRWGVLAELIYHTRINETWFSEFSSFTEWMNHLSKDYKISKARCWRYRKAADYYKTLQIRNKDLADLADLPKTVSAEALEILERLERVAKPSVVEQITNEVLEGTMPIRKLKQTWSAYKPKHPQQAFSILAASRMDLTEQVEAECVVALNESPAWCGHETPARYHVFKKVYVPNQPIAYDAIVLIQETLDSPVEVHTIHFWTHDRLGNSEINLKQPPHSPHADFCWFLLASDEPMYTMVATKMAQSQDCGLMILKSGIPTVSFSIPNKYKVQTPPFINELLKMSLRN